MDGYWDRWAAEMIETYETTCKHCGRPFVTRCEPCWEFGWRDRGQVSADELDKFFEVPDD